MRTARLGFGEWRREDMALAFALWGDPRVTRWIDVRGRLSHEEVARKLDREIEMAARHGVQYWPIFY